MTTTRSPQTKPAPTPEESRTPGAMALVIAREVRARGRTKGFVFSTLFMVALLVGVIVVPTVFMGGPRTFDVGVVGSGNDGIIAVAEDLAAIGVDDDDGVVFEVVAYPDVAAAEEAVAVGEVDAALVDGSQLLVARAGGWGSSGLTDLLQQAAVAERVVEVVGPAEAAQLGDALAGRALEVTAVSGQDAAQTDGRAALAYGGLILMYILIAQYGSWAMYGVTEEKASRVIEILLSAAPSWRLFTGKIIGIAALGLGQFAVVVVAALTAIRVTDAFALPVLPVGFAAVLGLWLLIGFGIYLVLFGAAGALATKMEDAQSAMSPIMTVIFVGFFASFAVLPNPDGVVAVVGTFIPFIAPFFVPIRAAMDAIPLWQHVASAALSIATAVAMVAVSARLYRGGALRFGGKVGWRQALRPPT